MAENSEQFTLLLVDDNPTNLLLLAKIVEFDLPQVRVLTARSGLEGLALASQQPVDGAFLDVQMPQMSGLEMCRALKADPRTAEIPVVLITAHMASAEMRAQGLEAGAYDFITQPISNVEMLARIKVMLRLCQGEQQQRRDRQQLQQQVAEHSEKLRWLSGLLLSGDGSLLDQERQLLQQLVDEFPDPSQLTEQQLLEKLADKFPLRWRRTLFKLALLDEVPFSLARKLSEIEDVEAVFAYLRRHDLSLQAFLPGRDRYVFRPQALNWLRQQARLFLGEQECREVLELAAGWYQQQGEPLAAFSCLVRGENYPLLSQLLSQLGLELSLACHRSEVHELVEQVPKMQAAECGWLSLYLGTGRMQRHAPDVASWLELAHSRFVADGDQRGELLVLSQQVIQYLLIDARIDLGLELLPRYRQLCRDVGPILSAVDRIKVLLSLGYAELFLAGQLEEASRIASELQSERVLADFSDLRVEAQLLRALLAMNQGRLRVARAAVEQGMLAARELNPMVRPSSTLQVVAAELLFTSGELSSFRRQVQSLEQCCGRDVIGQTVFGPLICFYTTLAQLARGDYSAAREQLDLCLAEGQAAFQPHLQSWVLQLRGWLKALSGHDQAAREDSAQALKLRRQCGGELFGLTNQLLAGACSATLGDNLQAETYLSQGLQDAKRLGAEKLNAGLHAWLALVYARQKKMLLAQEQLQAFLAQLAQQKLSFFTGLTPDLLKELLPLAGAAGQQQELVQQVAADWLGAAINVAGEFSPVLEVQTLGGFSLWSHGEPLLDLCEVGGASRQILALLLISPRQSLSLDLLMERLWPESSTSKARSSFDTALSRLRKALDRSLGAKGSRDYLVLEKGMLQLRQVQVDANSFKQAIATARRQLQRQDDWQAEVHLWKAERLWKGVFLAGFELLEELTQEQGLLTEARLDQVTMLAGLLLKQQRNAEAERLLREGLQLAGSYEPIVRLLLQLAVSSGNHRLHLQVVENYRLALQAESYSPAEIEEILESLDSPRPGH